MAVDGPVWVSGNERVLHTGFANKLGFWGSAGGRLTLTDKRLVFSNRRNNKILWEKAQSDIFVAARSGTFHFWSIFFLLVPLLIKNAVKVTFADGSDQRFVVSDKETWVAMINKYSAA